SESFCPTARAIRSVPPPGAEGTMIRIGRVGQSAALEAAVENTNAANIARRGPRVRALNFSTLMHISEKPFSWASKRDIISRSSRRWP
ncbi:MAG: hypothetical protein ACRED3_16785, partial [Bradyrhizobium sp.]